MFTQSDGSCHAYILHPPGGVVGGDELRLQVNLLPRSHVLVTTPGAAKFYRSAGPWGHQRCDLEVGSGAHLEWMPQESIAFAGTKTRTRTQVALAKDARLALWDILCLGRPAASETLGTGEVDQRLEIRIDGTLRWLEHARYGESSRQSHAPCGLRGYPVVGSLYYYPASPLWLEALRPLTEGSGAECRSGATCVDQLFVARVLAHHADHARKHLAALWFALRKWSGDGEAIAPRIWST